MLLRCCALLASLTLLRTGEALAQSAEQSVPAPLVLPKGVHLLVDDHFIARNDGVVRKVMTPPRFLDKPVVTGALEHQNWQPLLTVLYDPAAREKPFRMWYNVDVVDDAADGNFFGKSGYLESTDGIHWPGPYERLNTLTEDGRLRFGACVLDDGLRNRSAGERYKVMYFDAGKQVGPRAAFSDDGPERSRQSRCVATKPTLGFRNVLQYCT